MCFSATLSKKTQDFTKYTLKNPERIYLHSQRKIGEDQEQQNIADIYEAPNKLDQYYMVVRIGEKLDTLFSFLKSHLKSKILIFFSSCKQVRYVFETFMKLKPGMPLFELQGRQKQTKRLSVFLTFNQKKYGALFCTNIAARGLDIPSVDWIIQVDCPEDTETYLHRVGRTARYKADGKALLILLQEEHKFIQKLQKQKIIINKINANPNKQLTISKSLQAYCTEDVNIKYLAQKYLITYLRSIFLMKDKEVFNVSKLNTAELSESLGLIQAPVIKFVNKEDSEDEEPTTNKKLTKLEKLKQKIENIKQQKNLVKESNQNEDEYLTKRTLSVQNINERARDNQQIKDTFQKLRVQQPDDDDFLTIKNKDVQSNQEINEKLNPVLKISKNQMKKIKFDGIFGGQNKIMFDKDGNKYTQDEYRKKELENNLTVAEKDNIDYVKKYQTKLILNKEQDDMNEAQRRKDKRLKKKQKLRNKEMEKHGMNAVLDSDDEEVNSDQSVDDY